MSVRSCGGLRMSIEICILSVLLTLGPGAISFDALLRHLYRREQGVNA